MSQLHARKEMILAEADLHRQILMLERLRWQRYGAQAQQLVATKRWWLIGGAMVAGALIARRWRGFASWLPMIMSTTRALLR